VKYKRQVSFFAVTLLVFMTIVLAPVR